MGWGNAMFEPEFVHRENVYRFGEGRRSNSYIVDVQGHWHLHVLFPS